MSDNINELLVSDKSSSVLVSDNRDTSTTILVNDNGGISDTTIHMDSDDSIGEGALDDVESISTKPDHTLGPDGSHMGNDSADLDESRNISSKECACNDEEKRERKRLQKEREETLEWIALKRKEPIREEREMKEGERVMKE